MLFYYYFWGVPKSPKSKEAIPKEAIPKEAIPKEAINCFLFIKRKQLLPFRVFFVFVRRCSAWNGSRAMFHVLCGTHMIMSPATADDQY
jgi:hypothetical protein